MIFSGGVMEEKIDFVITWVDGSDDKWISKKIVIKRMMKTN